MFISVIVTKIHAIRLHMLNIFIFKQIEEWTFNVSGVGLYPTPISMEKASTFLDTHKTITIPFQNPTLEEVIIDITLSSK